MIEKHSGTEVQSGTGTDIYRFSHGCSIRPFNVMVVGSSADALILGSSHIPFQYTWDGTTVTVKYLTTAPHPGTHNLIWNWIAECN